MGENIPKDKILKTPKSESLELGGMKRQRIDRIRPQTNRNDGEINHLERNRKIEGIKTPPNRRDGKGIPIFVRGKS